MDADELTSLLRPGHHRTLVHRMSALNETERRRLAPTIRKQSSWSFTGKHDDTALALAVLGLLGGVRQIARAMPTHGFDDRLVEAHGVQVLRDLVDIDHLLALGLDDDRGFRLVERRDAADISFRPFQPRTSEGPQRDLLRRRATSFECRLGELRFRPLRQRAEVTLPSATASKSNGKISCPCRHSALSFAGLISGESFHAERAKPFSSF